MHQTAGLALDGPNSATIKLVSLLGRVGVEFCLVVAEPAREELFALLAEYKTIAVVVRAAGRLGLFLGFSGVYY